MVNPAMPPRWSIPLGESAELIAQKHGISREEQDATRSGRGHRVPPMAIRPIGRRARQVAAVALEGDTDAFRQELAAHFPMGLGAQTGDPEAGVPRHA